jgi:hypothetical protein
MPNNRDLQGMTAEIPTHDEIEKRAYDLYLQDGEVFSTSEYWLIAEDGLKKERATVEASCRRKKLRQQRQVVLRNVTTNPGSGRAT